ncbi:MAG: T9SS type A sorting domain-containing protein [Bacteroidales bacterium]
MTKHLRYLISVFIVVFFCLTTVGQDRINSQQLNYEISQSDSIALTNLPELKADIFKLKTDLPDHLDNSIQPYFRDLFEQQASECGQYAAISFNLTYELAYRRNVSAMIPDNQFPTHYAYNFMNGGNGWHGVNYFHSYEIARTNGHPNVVDYGGLATGGPSRWLSGYEKYYNGMFNKVENVYQIRVDTPEGLLMFKNWLFNHLEGDAVGGLGTYYSSSPWNPVLLPAGTPEGGKHVITNYIGPAGHSVTVTGWNDSIRWDYNNDGQYTNDIDINGDGEVTMKDWEIGGLLFMDSFIGGLGWADSAYCYAMYKTLAEKPIDGGIWNQAVHIVKVKEDYAPKLTMKVKLNHTSRNKIKVLAGVAGDPESLSPEKTLGFPIFDYQGGNQFMQGGNTIPENKIIEFGLDITPLLGEIESGEDARFFLQVHEDDPQNQGTGEIEYFSVISYSNAINEFIHPASNVPLFENAVTTLGLVTNFNFNQLHLTTSGLPVGIIDEPYSHQMQVYGGTPPYEWNLIRHYEIEYSTGSMPSIDEAKLFPSDTVLGIAMQAIDFPFPFYGKEFDTLYIHTEGFIMFDNQDYPWPYLFDEHLMIKKLEMIAPYLNSKIVLDTLNGDGVWFEGDENSAAFRWRCTSVSPVMSDINFAVVLFPSGKIEYYYGNDDMFVDHMWASGISSGDDINYHYANPDENKVTFNPSLFPEEMSLSSDGLFTGTPLNKYSATPIEFLVTDYNTIAVRKTLPFNSWYEDVEEWESELNSSFQVYPNPFSDQIKMDFELKHKTHVSLRLYNLQGQEVISFLDQKLQQGDHHFNFDLGQTAQPPLNEGVYFCTLKTDQSVVSKKLVLMNND